MPTSSISEVRSPRGTWFGLRQAAWTCLLSLVLTGLLGGCGTDAAVDGAGPLPSFTSPAGVSNGADVRFAQQIGPHQDQAVEMSRILLDKEPAAEAAVRGIAEQITVTQEPAVQTTSGWLAAWGKAYEVDTTSTGEGHHGGGGVMSETEMRELDKSSTALGQQLYLEHMIEHHQRAVALAETEINEGVNPEALQYAQATLESHTAQIATMKQLSER